MWESRVLCEISKRLWKSFCDFHRRAISTAVFGASTDSPAAMIKLDGTSGRRTRDRIRSHREVPPSMIAIGREASTDHRARS
jgi:hypothetical protein